MIRIICHFFVLITVLFIISCGTGPTQPTGNGTTGTIPRNAQGEIVYVAIGNSLTAGMQASALSSSTEQYSFPVLLAKQLGRYGKNFTYPQWTIGSGADTYPNDDQRYRKTFQGYNKQGKPIIGKAVANDLFPSNYADNTAFHNLGIPGAFCYDLLDSTDFLTKSLSRPNPFFFQVLRTRELGKNVIEQAKSLAPTLLTFWIGNNDVLTYALSGGTSRYYPDYMSIGPTPPPIFKQHFEDALSKTIRSMPQAACIVMNIPNVLFAPRFTYISYGKVINEYQKDSLNLLLTSQGLPPRLITGFNSYTITTKNGVRLAKSSDIILNEEIMRQHPDTGLVNPLADNLVLDETEQGIVLSTIQEYNTIIATAVQSLSKTNNTIYLMNMFEVMNSIAKNGYTMSNGTKITAEFITGGLFSTDGIHPTSRGYGILVNEIITQIVNGKMNGDIPLLSLEDLETIDTE